MILTNIKHLKPKHPNQLSLKNLRPIILKLVNNNKTLLNRRSKTMQLDLAPCFRPYNRGNQSKTMSLSVKPINYP